MSKLKTGVLSIGGIVVGIVTLRAFRKRRSDTDEAESIEDGEAESAVKKDEAESLEDGEAESSSKKEEAESSAGDDAPETAAEHAEVAAEHALLAAEKSIESRIKD